ncbi:beta-1,4-N-acetylgalactosaminyltransferase bre-4 isoform X2 [Halyomorpha halys]|uniref:beta-1,4-N-acetylgalactosaminyltransferase bre-4 isoform X2 n=1 Tax=Halyomorpha halys TaxID=286706 RepID=UPI0006D4FD1E|nr:beta-1,4-N-acetylgalactosaminyltransferase bre-4-like isoform X2 [Halyomorpha halys]
MRNIILSIKRKCALKSGLQCGRTMRIRVRGTLTRVRPKIRVSAPGRGYRCIRILPLLSVFIIVTALSILALSEMSVVAKDTVTGVIGGGGAASRIMPGRAHTRLQHHKPTHQEKGMSFKMEPLLRRDALSVELTAQMVVNRYRGGVIANIIEKESVYRGPLHCSPPPRDCPSVPPNLYGRIDVETWLKETKPMPNINLTYVPKDCSPRHAVAIIIPYRDREKQLSMLMSYLPPILERQQLAYHIFIVEQIGNDTFNKGLLMNAGALTALEYHSYPGVMFHCLVFHDVDMLPEDDRILYSCPQQPRHLSVAVNELNYRLPYRQLVGGVFSIRTDHFLRVNGYSNLFWGWGGEDDDMGYRVEHVLLWISRPPEWIARYTMIKHEKRRPLARKVRTKLLRTSWRRYRLDGLNTAAYGLMEMKHISPILTHILIDVGHPPNSIKQLQQEEEGST